MSTESAKTIKRQWYIVRYLLRGNYVSSSEINSFLSDLGIDIDVRTVQRDLKILQDVFPLECRQDSKPYSWRWKRIQNTTMGEIDLSKALALCLIRECLTDIFAPQLIQQLEPLFEKANVVVGMAAEESFVEDTLTAQQKRFMEKKMYAGTVSLGVAQKITHWFNHIINNETERMNSTNQIFLKLADALTELDLIEIAADFK